MKCAGTVLLLALLALAPAARAEQVVQFEDGRSLVVESAEHADGIVLIILQGGG